MRLDLGARRLRALTISLILAACSGDAPTSPGGRSPDWNQASEWTTYQGNARHTGFVPVAPDPAVFRERWASVPFGAVGLHPVAEGDGRVFVSTFPSYGREQLAALDAKTGAVLWSHDFGDIHAVHPPAYANGSVYVATSAHQDSFLWAFEAGTGKPRFRSFYGSQWSGYYAPVIVDDALYMAGGQGVYNFNTTDGTQRWVQTTNEYDEWTPAVHEGLVYIYTGLYSPKVSVLEAATGRQAYEIPDPKFKWAGWSMHLAPVLGGSRNLLATNGGRLISFNLETRTIGWEQQGSFVGTVTVAESLLYVVNGGHVDVRRESDGSLVAPWVPPEGSIQAPMVVTKNLLFASTATATYAIDLTTRQHVWSYPAGGRLALSRHGLLLIAQANGKLAAIAVK